MGTVQTSPRGECLHSSWQALNACSQGNRHQSAPLVACTFSRRDPDREAPNRRRSSRAFGRRDDAGPGSPNTREKTWIRPHCSSSSSWYYCSAAADSFTDAGPESGGRCSLAGIIRPLLETRTWPGSSRSRGFPFLRQTSRTLRSSSGVARLKIWWPMWVHVRSCLSGGSNVRRHI